MSADGAEARDAAAEAAVRPTAPDLGHVDEVLGTAATAEAAPVRAQWGPPPDPAPRAAMAPSALALAILALAASLFVGWAAPLGLIAAIVAVVSLRRPIESRALALWALALAVLSLIYSAGWLLWAVPRL